MCALEVSHHFILLSAQNICFCKLIMKKYIKFHHSSFVNEQRKLSFVLYSILRSHRNKKPLRNFTSKFTRNLAASKTWTQTLDHDPGSGPWKTWTLKNLDSEKPVPWKTWTQKNLDPAKPGPWKIWTLTILDYEKPGKQLEAAKTIRRPHSIIY